MANKWAQIASQWKHFALEAKKEWDELTDEELIETQHPGKRGSEAIFCLKLKCGLMN